MALLSAALAKCMRVKAQQLMKAVLKGMQQACKGHVAEGCAQSMHGGVAFRERACGLSVLCSGSLEAPAL
eukprot:1161745-Pelagomonas_calceolata.AAC.6